MEPDRYQQNQKFYIVGIICLALGLSLFAFSAYLFPFLILKWQYSMPSFIVSLIAWMLTYHELSPLATGWFVFLIFFIPALLLVVVADVVSNRIDSEIHDLNLSLSKEAAGHHQQLDRASLKLILKIILIIILIFVLARMAQWTIAITMT